jgi:hypothetical protein
MSKRRGRNVKRREEERKRRGPTTAMRVMQNLTEFIKGQVRSGLAFIAALSFYQLFIVPTVADRLIFGGSGILMLLVAWWWK